MSTQVLTSLDTDTVVHVDPDDGTIVLYPDVDREWGSSWLSKGQARSIAAMLNDAADLVESKEVH